MTDRELTGLRLRYDVLSLAQRGESADDLDPMQQDVLTVCRKESLIEVVDARQRFDREVIRRPVRDLHEGDILVDSGGSFLPVGLLGRIVPSRRAARCRSGMWCD